MIIRPMLFPVLDKIALFTIHLSNDIQLEQYATFNNRLSIQTLDKPLYLEGFFTRLSFNQSYGLLERENNDVHEYFFVDIVKKAIVGPMKQEQFFQQYADKLLQTPLKELRDFNWYAFDKNET